MAEEERSNSPVNGDEADSTNKDSRKPTNAFVNDGTFMAMFKKMQERQNKEEEIAASSFSTASIKHSGVGKRRGGRVLPVGTVKKQRKEIESEEKATPLKADAWSQYMNEVRKYREQSCEEEGKRRPLVK